ncbi:MAG: outer membrane beta-barrel protein [Proteobacteria bacterium]|nr:outer membrane beta-barrel protein [Pseudomonadota bacterium]
MPGMPSRGRALRALSAASLTLASAAALADGALSPYLGGGAGQAQLRADPLPGYDGTSLSDHRSGWTAVVGLRPLSMLGVELQYTDFGRLTRTIASPVVVGTAVTGTASAKGTIASAVGYLPLPVPFLDVYGKAGVARLQTAVSAYRSACEVQLDCFPFPASRSDTSSRFAYGAGAQFKLRALAFRVEYDRVSAPGGDPSLAWAGVTWSF